MKMHNPPNPGDVLKTLCLKPLNLTVTEAARSLGVSRKTLSSILNGRAAISPEMAVRLSIAFDTSAESWLNQQLSVRPLARGKTPEAPQRGEIDGRLIRAIVWPRIFSTWPRNGRSPEVPPRRLRRGTGQGTANAFATTPCGDGGGGSAEHTGETAESQESRLEAAFISRGVQNRIV